MPVWPLALAVLPAGFAVAEATGVRALGGLVLVAGGLAVVSRAREAAVWRRLTWGAVTFAGFVLSHVLANNLTTWGAVACVASLSGGTAMWLLDRRESRHHSATLEQRAG